jgi:hypothetical protein
MAGRGTTLKLAPALLVSQIALAGNKYLCIPEVDEDLASAFLENDASDGRLAASGGGDPLRREPARQPLLDVLPQRDSRQMVHRLLLLLDGNHLLCGQLGRGGAECEAAGGGRGGVETEERGRLGLRAGGGG